MRVGGGYPISGYCVKPLLGLTYYTIIGIIRTCQFLDPSPALSADLSEGFFKKP